MLRDGGRNRALWWQEKSVQMAKSERFLHSEVIGCFSSVMLPLHRLNSKLIVVDILRLFGYFSTRIHGYIVPGFVINRQ